jgi:hypothetical protein
MAQQFASMSPMVNKAIKGAAVGASVGFALWLCKQFVPAQGRAVQVEELNEAANVVLSHDADFRTLCLQLRPYAKFDPDTYAQLLLNVARVIDLAVRLQRGEMVPRFSTPKDAAILCDNIINSIRRLRATLAHRVRENQAVMREFDEIAADCQRKCTEYQYNITQTVNYHFS